MTGKKQALVASASYPPLFCQSMVELHMEMVFGMKVVRVLALQPLMRKLGLGACASARILAFAGL